MAPEQREQEAFRDRNMSRRKLGKPLHPPLLDGGIAQEQLEQRRRHGKRRRRKKEDDDFNLPSIDALAGYIAPRCHRISLRDFLPFYLSSASSCWSSLLSSSSSYKRTASTRCDCYTIAIVFLSISFHFFQGPFHWLLL